MALFLTAINNGKRLAKEQQQAQAEAVRLRAQLGEAVEANAEQKRPTMRGFKVA